MQILMTGSTGLIGSALREHWPEHTIHAIHHRSSNAQRRWNSPLQLEQLPPLDMVVHLAGAGIADKRWSTKRKQTIIDSRVSTTEQLVAEILRLEHKPAVVLCASAIGYYGDRGNELLEENSTADVGFSGKLCTQWEACTQPLVEAGIRVVNLRFGIVLSPDGGALAKMLPAFKFGGGGKMGDGRQWMSWISITDVLRAIDFLVAQPQIEGPVNMTAPEPVPNQVFSKELARVLHRPCFLNMPTMAIKLLFGQMGEELLLGSARVNSTVLQTQGYQFTHPQLGNALAELLGVTAKK